ncbi:MAG: PaaI family thioesterase [Chrysiogenetes bacterium]|nr:PaaI family thioesterase [Chrysiogenetes bacterium]
MEHVPANFEAIAPAAEEQIKNIIKQAPYPKFLGLYFEEVRKDYARMRLPYRPELNQPAGIVHGGALASLIDTAVVGAIFSNVGETFPKRIVTIDMHIHYMGAVTEKDVICHASVRRRGRSIVFLQTEAVDEDGKAVAHGELSYMLQA